MENKLPGSHRFFTIMMPEYMSKLPLPKVSCRKLDGQHSEVGIITTCKGKWKVNVEKSSDLLFFAGGWDTFARDHDLRVGNFIGFQHIGSMHFTAKIFDLTACETDFAVDLTNKKHGAHGKIDGLEMKHPVEQETPTKTGASDHKGRSLFTAVIRWHSVHHPSPFKYLPKAFWKAHGLDKQQSIILRDSSGREWPVAIKVHKTDRVIMGRGWSRFSKSNNLKVGDICIFSITKLSDECDSVSMDVSISRRSKEECF